MAFADGLRQGTFRGVAFQWNEADADLGRRIVKHEFPLRDRPWAEDLGRMAREITLLVFVVGDNWQAERDALITRLRGAGPQHLGASAVRHHAVAVTACQVREHTAALAGETLSGVERFQQYGFTSVPVSDAGAVFVRVAGNRSHPIVITVEDRRYRLKGPQDGDMALYDGLGHVLRLGRTGIAIDGGGHANQHYWRAPGDGDRRRSSGRRHQPEDPHPWRRDGG